MISAILFAASFFAAAPAPVLKTSLEPSASLTHEQAMYTAMSAAKYLNDLTHSNRFEAKLLVGASMRPSTAAECWAVTETIPDFEMFSQGDVGVIEYQPGKLAAHRLHSKTWRGTWFMMGDNLQKLDSFEFTRANQRGRVVLTINQERPKPAAKK